MTIRARAQYEVGMNDNTKAALTSIRKSVVATTKVVAGLGAVVAAGAFAKLVNDARDTADQVQKLSLRLQDSAENISSLQVLAGRSDVGFLEIAENLKKANDRISEGARGQGKAADAIARLGLDIQKLKSLNPTSQLLLIAEAMERLSPAANKLDLATDIFSGSGAKMLQVMEGGEEAILDAMHAADQFGITISGKTANEIANANDRLGDLGFAMQGAANIALIQLAPSLERLAVFLSESLPKGIYETNRTLIEMQATFIGFKARLADFFGADELFGEYITELRSLDAEYKRSQKVHEQYLEDLEAARNIQPFENVFNQSLQKDQFQRDLNEVKRDLDKSFKEISELGDGVDITFLQEQFQSAYVTIQNITKAAENEFDLTSMTKQLGDVSGLVSRITGQADQMQNSFGAAGESISKKSRSELEKVAKLLGYAEEYIFKEKDALFDERLQGQFRQVNLSRFSFENAGAKPMRTEDPQLKTTNSRLKDLIELVDRKLAVQEIAAL